MNIHKDVFTENIRIKSITLDINGIETTLSARDAMDLYDQLAQVFKYPIMEESSEDDIVVIWHEEKTSVNHTSHDIAYDPKNMAVTCKA